MEPMEIGFLLLQNWLFVSRNLPNQRLQPTPLSRRITGGASRKALSGFRKALGQVAARLNRDRWAGLRSKI
jgi:hypothetical protein